MRKYPGMEGMLLLGIAGLGFVTFIIQLKPGSNVMDPIQTLLCDCGFYVCEAKWTTKTPRGTLPLMQCHAGRSIFLLCNLSQQSSQVQETAEWHRTTVPDNFSQNVEVASEGTFGPWLLSYSSYSNIILLWPFLEEQYLRLCNSSPRYARIQLASFRLNPLSPPPLLQRVEEEVNFFRFALRGGDLALLNRLREFLRGGGYQCYFLKPF